MDPRGVGRHRHPASAGNSSPDRVFLLVTPRGGIILCEDDAGGSDGDTHPLAPGITDVNRLIGLTVRGEAFEFAVNRLNDAEFAGACFSPSGKEARRSRLPRRPPARAGLAL